MSASRRPVWIVLGVLGAMCGGCLTNDMARLRGHQAYEDGDYAVARAYFQRCVHRDPTDWKSQYYMGLLALADGRPTVARHSLELAYVIRQDRTSLSPGRPKLNEPPPPPSYLEDDEAGRWPTLAQIIDAIAESLYQEGNAPRLAAFCQEAIDTYGTTRDYLRLARYLQLVGDHDGALATFRKAAKVAQPDDAEPYVAMANFYEAIGQDKEAILSLRRAHYVQPEDRRIADRLRGHGIVPGPTIQLPPER